MNEFQNAKSNKEKTIAKKRTKKQVLSKYEKILEAKNKANKRYENTKPDNKNLVVKEIEEEYTPLTLTNNLNNKYHEVIIDTGASSNYMSTESAKQMKLEGRIKPLKKKGKIEVPNRQTQEIINFVATSLRTENFQTIDYKVKFKIIESTKQLIILGMQFLIYNRAVRKLIMIKK